MILSLCKRRHRLTVLVLAIAVIAAVPGSDNGTESDAAFRRWLPEVLELLCPYSKTCRGGEPRLQLEEGKESCCTECSCEDSCGLTESCCYPEQATIRHFDRSQQQCECSSTIRDDPMWTGNYFYMVTRGYGNGSEEDCGTAHTTCGENEAASALGSLYPVSSKMTGIIYKNEQCARCHGVARSDMMPWKAVMTCSAPDAGDMGLVLQSLETDRAHASCVFDFYYPGPKSEANIHLCYEKTPRSCLHREGQSYKIPSYLNMTENEVRTACLTGPQAQYRYYGSYYNVFCRICSYSVYHAEKQCIDTDLGVGRVLSPGTFSALLGSSFFEHKSLAKRTDMDTKLYFFIACKLQNGSQIDTADCRPALCPTGKVRLGADCVHHTETLFSRKFKVTVKLYPGDNAHITPLIDHLRAHLAHGEDWRALIVAPELDSWQMTELCYLDGPQQAMDSGQTGFFLLKVNLKKNTSSSLSELLASVNKFMTEDWKFMFNMTSVPLERSFSEFVDIHYFRSAYNLYSGISQSTKSRDLPEAYCSMHESPDDDSYSITKVFFCEQISLRPGEYSMNKHTKALYINGTGRVFTQAEYSLRYDASGNPVPRLCVEDTEYVLMPKQRSASQTIATSCENWLFVTSVVIAQLIY